MRAGTRYVEEVRDSDGFVVDGGYLAWDCERCGIEVCRYHGQGDILCSCGAWYNAGGQRLRDDWTGNPSWKYGDCGDVEGYEIQHANDQ